MLNVTDPQAPDGVWLNLLVEPLIAYRRTGDAAEVRATLPQLLAALGRDEVRDYPALRAHQRHPWHAFLCQLAAIALHQAGTEVPWADAADWCEGLRALTPGHADDAPWCLVSPPSRPALLQAPTRADLRTWKGALQTPDEADLLITAKNHDLKACRARDAEPQDWLFALVSRQTQEGYSGKFNYGISRMNGGFASRPGVGIAVGRHPGSRWRADVGAMLRHREAIVENMGLVPEGGHALVWLRRWDGDVSLPFSSLDPYYIELCRRIRCLLVDGRLQAVSTGSQAARIDAGALNGRTGDPWTPIDIAAGKALTLNGRGFDYRLASELLFGGRYAGGCAQDLSRLTSLASVNDDEPLHLSMRGLVRGQGKTEGLHERQVPIAPRVRRLLAEGSPAGLARVARERVDAIAAFRKLLWGAMVVLFSNGKPGSEAGDVVKDRATRFSRVFEVTEDLRFFDDLEQEFASGDTVVTRLAWLIGLAQRGEGVLRDTFIAGPRSGLQGYRARTAALARWHGGLRGDQVPAALRPLSQHLRIEKEHRKEEARAA
ncbi:type I-E CRISPR-associated protein Cse1/CasA [Leptothrix sp. BB-4]